MSRSNQIATTFLGVFLLTAKSSPADEEHEASSGVGDDIERLPSPVTRLAPLPEHSALIPIHTRSSNMRSYNAINLGSPSDASMPGSLRKRASAASLGAARAALSSGGFLLIANSPPPPSSTSHFHQATMSPSLHPFIPSGSSPRMTRNRSSSRGTGGIGQ